MTVQTLPSAPSSALVPGYLMPGPERARHWLGQLLVFIGITGILLPIDGGLVGLRQWPR